MLCRIPLLLPLRTPAMRPERTPRQRVRTLSMLTRPCRSRSMTRLPPMDMVYTSARPKAIPCLPGPGLFRRCALLGPTARPRPHPLPDMVCMSSTVPRLHHLPRMDMALLSPPLRLRRLRHMAMASTVTSLETTRIRRPLRTVTGCTSSKVRVPMRFGRCAGRPEFG